jgi:hypothetical protein
LHQQGHSLAAKDSEEGLGDVICLPFLSSIGISKAMASDYLEVPMINPLLVAICYGIY